MTILERFWSKVAVQPDGCWLWTGSVNQRWGYGRFTIYGKETKAHQFSYILYTHEDIPEGYDVCHVCDSPPCVRPEHLFLGTTRDNNIDKELKGRGNHPSGSRHGMARLTEQEVIEIRALRESGVSTVVIAGMYGVSDSHIRNICRGHKWSSR